MHFEIEWNYDRTAFRAWEYRGDELVDVTPWLVPAPTPLTLAQRWKRRVELGVVSTFCGMVLYLAGVHAYIWWL